MNKKYTASRYGINFYGETLEELANAIKNAYPNNNIKTFYPAEWHPLYRVYVAMNYHGYDINTLEKKSPPKRKKNKVDKKPMMNIEIDYLKLLFIKVIESTNPIINSSDELISALKKIYNSLPDDEKKQINEKYSISLELWNLK
jgi:hypothetical protein